MAITTGSEYEKDSVSVLICGGVSWDGLIGLKELPSGRPGTIFSSSFHEATGGTGAGKALNLARLGFRASLHGTVGDDDCGRKLRQAVEAGGVRFLADVDRKGTERHTNLMDAEGRRISIYCAYASFEPAIDQAALEAEIGSSDIVILNITNYCKRLIPAAKKTMASRGGLWVDIHDWDGKNPYHKPFVDAADCLFMSSDMMDDWRPFMEEMIQSGKKLVVCTHGAKGASALSGDGIFLECPIVKDYGYVDSNGAGDAFFSGYLAASVKGLGPRACLRMGTLAGALCVASKELANPKMSWEMLQGEYLKIYGEAP